MCLACNEPYGSIVSLGPFHTTPGQADPLIRQHAIHWVLSQEVYATSRRGEIEGWVLQPDYSTPDTCVYTHNSYSIMAFRGSVNLADVRSDQKLSKPGGNGCAFDKVQPAIEIVQRFLGEDVKRILQTTGHSLGGSVARCVAQHLGLGVITFNAGAPPSNPVTNGPNEVDYHM